MIRTTFHIPQMDCASEEQLIRMKLQDESSVRNLLFDLEKRKLIVYHDGLPEALSATLSQIKMEPATMESVAVDGAGSVPSPAVERRTLLAVLLINAGCFVLEVTTGLISRSMGLVADSLDMLADAIVYGLALIAAGGAARRKKRIATAAGYFQLALAAAGFAEVIRRFLGYAFLPAFRTMIVVSLIALVANAVSLRLLQATRSNEPHLKASMIFTSNDIIINIGVILAGVMVFFTGSGIPDLVVGTVVFLLVTRGAIRILKLGQ